MELKDKYNYNKKLKDFDFSNYKNDFIENLRNKVKENQNKLNYLECIKELKKNRCTIQKTDKEV